MNKLLQFKSNLKGLLDFSKKIANITKQDDLFFLKGELGSGKTTFAKAFINSLFELEKTKPPQSIKSPSFPIVLSYPLKNYVIYHYDFYRIKKKKELHEIGFFEDKINNISIVEWPNIILNNNEFSNYFLIEFDIIDLNNRLIKIFHSNRKTI